MGRATDLNTSRIRKKMTPMDTTLTVLKSLSVISIRSLVQGASPTSIPLPSTALQMPLSFSHCRLTSRDATLY